MLEAEARLRKRDLFVGEAGVAAFYDERLPPTVHDRASLASWCAGGQGVKLSATLADFADSRSGRPRRGRLLRELRGRGAGACRCVMRFEPGQDTDGITVTVPRSLLGAIRIDAARLARAGVVARQGRDVFARAAEGAAAAARAVAGPGDRRARGVASARGGRHCRSRSPKACAPRATSRSSATAFDEPRAAAHLKLRGSRRRRRRRVRGRRP